MSAIEDISFKVTQGFGKFFEVQNLLPCFRKFNMVLEHVCRNLLGICVWIVGLLPRIGSCQNVLRWDS